jgi:hypothetical protein
MMIPGLPSSGHKYEHDKNQPTAIASPADNMQSLKASGSQQQSIPGSEIE